MFLDAVDHCFATDRQHVSGPVMQEPRPTLWSTLPSLFVVAVCVKKLFHFQIVCLHSLYLALHQLLPSLNAP
jgi:hypothetical protein